MLAAAEEHLRNARLEVALEKHRTKVAARVSQMRDGGASDLEIAVYEAEQAVEEAKIEACLARPQVRSTLPGNSFRCWPQAVTCLFLTLCCVGAGVSRRRGGATAQC